MSPTSAASTSPWLDRASARLAAAGVDSARHDAVLLAVEGVGLSRTRLGTVTDPPAHYWTLVERRASREPLQHVLGRAWFRHVDVAVGRGVFVPRPETELVAGAAIDEALAIASRGRTPVVLDLGTGSGVIALSVAHEVPGSVVHAVEVDEHALAWARRNCDGTRVVLHHGDLANALHDCPELCSRVDVVVSNPPYIPPDGVPVQQEVRDHDPARALYGSGSDGLGEVRAVVETARRLLADNGLVVVEHADRQGAEVLALLGHGWLDAADHLDLAGRPRYVTARRAPRSA